MSVIFLYNKILVRVEKREGSVLETTLINNPIKPKVKNTLGRKLRKIDKDGNTIEVTRPPAPELSQAIVEVKITKDIGVTEVLQVPERLKTFDGKFVINLNTHEVSVLDGMNITVYPRYKVRPKIIYKSIPDKKAYGAHRLVTRDVIDLPLPTSGIIYIVNRDTISATRKIEKQMRKNPEFKNIFEVIDADPNTWRQSYLGKFPVEMIRKALKFVDRVDLRAPGEQVRDSNNRVSHCRGLMSEFE